MWGWRALLHGSSPLQTSWLWQRRRKSVGLGKRKSAGVGKGLRPFLPHSPEHQEIPSLLRADRLNKPARLRAARVGSGSLPTNGPWRDSDKGFNPM